MYFGPGPFATPLMQWRGRSYVTALDGVVTVLKAGESEPQVVAQNSGLGKRTAATPAIADDCLYHAGGKRPPTLRSSSASPSAYSINASMCARR